MPDPYLVVKVHTRTHTRRMRVGISVLIRMAQPERNITLRQKITQELGVLALIK